MARVGTKRTACRGFFERQNVELQPFRVGDLSDRRLKIGNPSSDRSTHGESATTADFGDALIDLRQFTAQGLQPARRPRSAIVAG